MRRKQGGGSVPIGDALADVGGPVKAIREAGPPERHFTQADQVNQLVSASEADPDLGFMALCSLRASCHQARYRRTQGVFLPETLDHGRRYRYG